LGSVALYAQPKAMLLFYFFVYTQYPPLACLLASHQYYFRGIVSASLQFRADYFQFLFFILLGRAPGYIPSLLAASKLLIFP
jgi:hypothetical protein